VGPLIRRVNETQVGEIADQLANLLLKEKNDDVRDIASLGLKVWSCGLMSAIYFFILFYLFLSPAKKKFNLK
jgi:hypothetical protein